MPKAKFICSVKDKYNAYATNLFYAYRGKEYMITRYDNGCCDSLKEQHRMEQKRIDGLLDNPSDKGAPSGEVDRVMAELYSLWNA